MESSAFGEVIIKTQTTKNNLRFPGQYYDVDIKLAQNYFRDYAPSLGRYVETDPIGLDGGINFYFYAKGHPIKNIDYNGLVSRSCELNGTCCEEKECEDWMKIELEDLDWLKKLGKKYPCPCKENGIPPSWEDDNPVGEILFHGRNDCYRSPMMEGGYGQQCCYDSTGSLVTHGFGAGTPDKVHVDSPSGGHKKADVDPFFDCGWRKYTKVRIPDNSNNCPKNSG